MKDRLFFLIVIFSTPGLAQTVNRLTFREAVKIGLENNVTLNQHENTLASTQINKTSSLLQLGPSIYANASVYRNDGNSFNQQQGEVVNGVIDFASGNVGASVPVFNGLQLMNAYKQARSQNEAQLHQVNRSRQDVIRDVANQYLICLLDIELIKIDLQNVEAQRIQYDQIKEQVLVGSIAEADLYNQEYQLKNAELLLVRSRNKLRDDMAILALTLQIDPSIPFELEEIQWDVNSVMADTVSLEQMGSVALQRRDDLKMAEYNEKAAHFGFSALKGRYYPSLNAGVDFSSRYNYIHGRNDNRSFNDQFMEDNRQFGYGVRLSIPIYNGLSFRSQAAQARAQYQNAKLLHTSTEVTVKTDVLRAHQNFRAAISSYEAAVAQLRAAELSYKTEKERYDLEISNIVQLALINQTYIRAQVDYQSALYTLMFQKLLINHALGTLSFEDIP